MVACWACGSPTAPSAALAPLPFLECPDCGLAQRDDRDAEQLGGVYADGDYGDDWADEYSAGARLDDRRRDARVRLDWIGPRLPPGAVVLDVGAAGGAFVEQAGLRGLRAWGIEPAPSFARHAREVLGADVRPGLVQDHELPDASLDAVTMWHVLEHLAEPGPVLTRLREALRPGGVLCVEVPNAASAVARALGLGWPGLQPEVHVGQFTPDALGRLLVRAGFEVRELVTVPSEVYFTRRDRLGPRTLLHRARFGRASRPGPDRPAGANDLLRAVAARPPIV
jgi:SAM-dependent methyltransferase